MSQPNKEIFKNKFLNQIIRVTTKNGRLFEGKLKAIDFRGNIVLYHCVAEIPAHQNCPLNAHLCNIMDNKLKFEVDENLPAEQKERLKEEYFGSHYFIGAVMISGSDIVKIELRTPPLVPTPKQEPKPKQEESAQTQVIEDSK